MNIVFYIRHEKIRDHAAICHGNIVRLLKDIDWSTVEFVETLSFNSMNYHFVCMMTSTDFSFSLFKNLVCRESPTFAEISKIQILAEEGIKLIACLFHII